MANTFNVAVTRNVASSGLLRTYILKKMKKKKITTSGNGLGVIDITEAQ
jgi:hypothetical protein